MKGNLSVRFNSCIDWFKPVVVPLRCYIVSKDGLQRACESYSQRSPFLFSALFVVLISLFPAMKSLVPCSKQTNHHPMSDARQHVFSGESVVFAPSCGFCTFYLD